MRKPVIKNRMSVLKAQVQEARCVASAYAWHNAAIAQDTAKLNDALSRIADLESRLRRAEALIEDRELWDDYTDRMRASFE